MEKSFNQTKFYEELKKRTKNKFPNCQYCGGNSFTIPEEMSSIVLSKNIAELQLGLSMPAGMVVCTRCGHVEFFALGALGLIPREEGEGSGKQ